MTKPEGITVDEHDRTLYVAGEPRQIVVLKKSTNCNKKAAKNNLNTDDILGAPNGKTFISCGQKHELHISDVQGKLLFSTTNQGKKRYVISNLVKSGIYIVTIKTPHTTTQKKIIIP